MLFILSLSHGSLSSMGTRKALVTVVPEPHVLMLQNRAGWTDSPPGDCGAVCSAGRSQGCRTLQAVKLTAPRPLGSRAAAPNARGGRAPRPLSPYPGPAQSPSLARSTPARGPLPLGLRGPAHLGLQDAVARATSSATDWTTGLGPC